MISRNKSPPSCDVGTHSPEEFLDSDGLADIRIGVHSAFKSHQNVKCMMAIVLLFLEQMGHNLTDTGNLMAEKYDHAVTERLFPTPGILDLISQGISGGSLRRAFIVMTCWSNIDREQITVSC